MKYLFIILSLLSLNSLAQINLDFNKRPIDCMDKWVVYPANAETGYAYGFIYLDPNAGLTLHYEGNFKVDSQNQIINQKLENSTKIRLKANPIKIALLPESKFDDLQTIAVPIWLKYYQSDENNINKLYSLGFAYNEWNECAKALGYLEQAYTINPQFKGLAAEMAFSYNCLNQFSSAINILKKELLHYPTDAYLYKELIYAQLNNGDIERGAETCEKALKVCFQKDYHAENCYNVLHKFYTVKNKTQFANWLPIAKKWAEGNSFFTKQITYLEQNFKN